MNEVKLAEAANVRALAVRKAIRRHRLVFLQLGALFAPLRSHLLAAISNRTVPAHQVAVSSIGDPEEPGILVVSGLEEFAATGSHAGVSMGQLRAAIDKLLDEGVDICLVSPLPRCAYQAVPGSSLIEDCAQYMVPLLGANEMEDEVRACAGAVIPAIAMVEAPPTLEVLFSEALGELGAEVLAALDHALYEVGMPNDFLDHLDARELEATRGAGLISRDPAGALEFCVPQRLSNFKLALADAMASIVAPQSDLGCIADGLWEIERTIRYHLREHAVGKFGAKWRSQVLHGDLNTKVLARAKADAAIMARSIAELRDPIEWLSLGELLEVVTHRGGAAGLQKDALIWQKFEQDIVPIRNRLSHMRVAKKGDRETVRMWSTRIAQLF